MPKENSIATVLFSKSITKLSYNTLTKKRLNNKDIMELIELSDINPNTPCKKCGNKIWFGQALYLTWKCPICGNLLYLHYGEFLQQIEIIMNSSRRNYYVYTQDGKKIMPKKNEELKKLRLLELT